jgi:hypothetical protein
MTVVAAVEGAAHALLEEAPEASARAVADFLAGVRGGDAKKARAMVHGAADCDPVMIGDSFSDTLSENPHMP